MVEYRPNDLDGAYGALANEARRTIVRGLLVDERRVTDLARSFDISLAAVSKHIRVLEEAGIVHRRVDGRSHWLSLDPRPLAAAEGWLEVTRRFWEERLDALEDLLGDQGPTR
jgi:DNA-binding transcriptional ArsR family regulator